MMAGGAEPASFLFEDNEVYAWVDSESLPVLCLPSTAYTSIHSVCHHIQRIKIVGHFRNLGSTQLLGGLTSTSST